MSKDNYLSYDDTNGVTLTASKITLKSDTINQVSSTNKAIDITYNKVTATSINTTTLNDTNVATLLSTISSLKKYHNDEIARKYAILKNELTTSTTKQIVSGDYIYATSSNSIILDYVVPNMHFMSISSSLSNDNLSSMDMIESTSDFGASGCKIYRILNSNNPNFISQTYLTKFSTVSSISATLSSSFSLYTDGPTVTTNYLA